LIHVGPLLFLICMNLNPNFNEFVKDDSPYKCLMPWQFIAAFSAAAVQEKVNKMKKITDCNILCPFQFR